MGMAEGVLLIESTFLSHFLDPCLRLAGIRDDQKNFNFWSFFCSLLFDKQLICVHVCQQANAGRQKLPVAGCQLPEKCSVEQD